MSSISNPKGGVATALDPDDAYFNEDVKHTIRKAVTSWLKNDEVLAVLETFQTDRQDWPSQAAQQPPGGNLFIFNRKVCRSFRNDTHNWRKKTDGRTVKETHEKLKVADQERLNCYYAHADTTDGLQRRCYWILEEPKADIVLVHYLCCASSRAGGHRNSANSLADMNGGTIAANRPKREAAQRARRIHAAAVYTEDDDDDEPTMDPAPSSSEYVPSSGELPNIGEPYYSGGVPPIPEHKEPSLPSLQEMHAQWVAHHGASSAPGTNSSVENLQGGSGDDGGDGGALEGPLFTQMSLGSAGGSQNLSALLAGPLMDSGMDSLQMRQFSREESMGKSMKQILNEFQADDVNISQLLNEMPSFSIPSTSWRRNTGLDAHAAAEAAALGEPTRSIKFGSRMNPNDKHPSAEASPLLAGASLNFLESSGLGMHLSDKPASVSTPSELTIPSGSSGAMSTQEASGNNAMPAAAAAAAAPPPSGAKTATRPTHIRRKSASEEKGPSGFVVGRVKEIVEAEGQPPHHTHRRTGSGDETFARRMNPTAALNRPSAADRSVAAAHAAAAATHEHRELQLQRVRQSRLISPYEAALDEVAGAPLGTSMPPLPPTAPVHTIEEDDSGLIDAPNALFRMTSHIVRSPVWLHTGSGGSSGGMSGDQVSADQAAGLLKHMSIDEAAVLADVHAVRVDAAAAAAAAVAEVDTLNGSPDGTATIPTQPPSGEELAVNESRDPSLSSLLEGMTMPSTGMDGDVLAQAMQRQMANAAKREGKVGQLE